MPEARLRARILTGLALVVAAFAIFDVPSAYAVARHAPGWLALALGLLAFPLVPVTWHALGERRRKRERAAAKVPPRSSTTGWDRLALRAGVTGLVVIGGMIALGGGAPVLHSLRRHALWFVPRAEPTLAADGEMFDLVPADADAVMWLRPTAAVSTALGLDVRSSRMPTETVVASRGTGWPPDLAVITRGDVDLFDAMSMVRGKPITWRPPGLDDDAQTTSSGLAWRATPGWKAAVGHGPPRELLAGVHGLPMDTFAVLAVRPDHGAGKEGVVSALAYLELRGDQVDLVASVEAKDLLAARRLADDTRRALTGAGGRWAARLNVCLAEHGATTAVWPEGLLVRLHASVNVHQIRDLARCL